MLKVPFFVVVKFPLFWLKYCTGFYSIYARMLGSGSFFATCGYHISSPMCFYIVLSFFFLWPWKSKYHEKLKWLLVFVVVHVGRKFCS